MAAYNAPANAHHGAQSLQQSALAVLHAPLSKVNHAHQPTSLPIQSVTPTIDRRWKRGRPVTFSSRAFSTGQVDLNIQAGTATVTPAHPGVAGSVDEHGDVETPLCQPGRVLEGVGDAATTKQRDTRAELSPPTLQHDQVAPVRTDDVVESSEEAPTANATPAGTHNTDTTEQTRVASDVHLDMKPASLQGAVLDDATDPDYRPSSIDEGSSKSEQNGSEAEEEPRETHTPLEFQIPEDLLRVAMTAAENTKASFWSSNLYRGSKDKRILVHYCKTKEVAERVAQHFVNEKVVGFDIEWKPYSHPSSIKKNVSLIQLACENRIALFHVALFSESTAAQLMPPTLKTILESPEIYKVGVAVKGDFSRIVKYLDVEPQGVFELSRLHNLVQFSKTEPSKVTNKLVGLAAQVHQHLQLPLYKGGHLVDDPEDFSNVRSSDWSLPLNHQQIHYAAADAYAGFRLYDRLEEKRKQLRPTPPRPLVCDYDSKPKPKSSDSKPRKKRQVAAKTDEAAEVTAQEVSASKKREEEQEVEAEEDPKQSQDTEGYETAQEDLLDSHQLEGEEPVSSEESYASTEESDEHVLIDSAPSLKNEEATSATAPRQRRVGRINLSQLKGPDPGYPTLRDDNGTCLSSDEDLIDISEASTKETLDQDDDSIKQPEEAEETDEFEDSELEEIFHGLSIDNNGRLLQDTNDNAMLEQTVASEHPDLVPQTDPESGTTQAAKEVQPTDDQPNKTAPPATPTDDPSSTLDEQRLINPLNDPEVIDHPHNLAQATTNDPAPPATSSKATVQQPGQPTTTPEFDLATSWARSYLASTVPSPTSHATAHIRATVPHLRAFHLWDQQGLSLGEVARHLRDPPLSESTVGSYVLQAIVLERMEYDEQAVRGVLMGMPEALRRGKWRGLAEKVGAK